MAEFMKFASVIGTGLSAGGAIAQGGNEQAMADFQAAQLQQRAGQTRASAQRAAVDARRQGKLATSALQARAGLDPGVARLAGDLAGDAEYRALTALYEGDERATGDVMQADALRRAGKQSRIAGYMKGVNSFLSMGADMGSRYGAGGFRAMDGGDYTSDGYIRGGV